MKGEDIKISQHLYIISQGGITIEEVVSTPVFPCRLVDGVWRVEVKGDGSQ